MNSVYLEPGIYVNIFEANVPDKKVTIFTASFKAFPKLHDLRLFIETKGWKARVYRNDDVIFAYGQDAHELALKDFQEHTVRLFDHPKWCARLITEGLSDHLKNQGYREGHGKGRVIFYEPEPYQTAASGRIKVFRGYDLRTIYLCQQRQLMFGLVVDICWEIQDINEQTLNMEEIARKYNAAIEVAQIQDEILPHNKINTEISRLRLQNHILPFIARNKEFTLPLSQDIRVTLGELPVRVILGASS